MDVSIFKELAKFNNIKFYEAPHAYFMGDEQMISVTTLLGRFRSEFEYDKLLGLSAQKAIRERVGVGQEDLDEIKEELAEEWVFENRHACYEGTTVHSYAENLLASKIFEPNISGFEYDEVRGADKKHYSGIVSYSQIEDTCAVMKSHVDDFYNDYIMSGKLIPIKSEMILGNTELKISGMADQLFYNTETETLQIWDWKTNKEFRRTSEYGQMLLHCLNHLEECQMNEYSVQLHIYKHIVEKSTNLKLDADCYIVWFNELNPSYEVIKCKDMRKEVVDVFEFKKNNEAMFVPHTFVRPKPIEKKEKLTAMDDLLSYNFTD